MITRSYNIVSEPENGTIKKSSPNEKLLDEINFYIKIQESNLPDAVKVLFPKYISHSHGTKVNATFEYIPMKNLYHYVSNNDFVGVDAIVRPLKWAILRMHSNEITLKDDTVIDHMLQMFVNKTETEHAKYKNSPNFVPASATMFDPYTFEPIKLYRLNGEALPEFDFMWPKVKEKYFTKNALSNLNGFAWTLMHGDCCLSNILADPPSGAIKFIDMRGSFGDAKGIHGSNLYDWAKLLHSVEGCYEDIIYNNYKFTSIPSNDFGGTHELLSFPTGTECRSILKESLFPRFNKDQMNLIRAVEATIFIGMCHRHSESPEHQQIMHLQGLKLLKQVAYD